MAEQVAGICWPHTATVGHVTVTTPFIHGTFTGRQGCKGIVTCDMVAAGRYRNGALRAWCRTHQHYWGTKADLAALAANGVQRCAHHDTPMHYVLNPLVIDVKGRARVGITAAGGKLCVQLDDGEASTVDALAISYDPATALFPAADIIHINVTPAMVGGLANSPAPECVCCKRCGHPHLDLGTFGSTAHKRHYCGHCGNDSTHSKLAIVSNPLVPLLQYYRATLKIPCSIVQTDNML